MSFHLKGFDNVQESTLSNEIQDNIIEFFDWALLNKGNYFNVTAGETAPNGYDYSKLRLSQNENFTAGTCWEGVRSNWVWQSGIESTPSPLVGTNNTKPGISGVYINDTFYPTTTTGSYAHHVDYYNGRVVFDNALPTGTKIQAEHSYKWINVVYANEVPWLREVQYRSYDINGEFFNQSKGDWDIPPEARLQLPAIAVEIVPRRRISGFQLGGGSFVETDVLFHCIAENELERNKLVDIVSLQNERTFSTYDSNLVADADEFPIDYRGFPVSGALDFKRLALTHAGAAIRFKNSSVQGMDVIGNSFYGGIVKMTAEVIKLNV
jgi:hypothetical protein|tara:strand:- start:5980 stop:6948 length:969 start_codon:yes stop_codon:yes gene_type:complete